MRWSRHVFGSDLFQLHKLFFPCNISQSHWSCIIADMVTKQISYFDSMQGNGDRYMHAILHYLQDDWNRTKGFVMPDVRQWTLHNARDTPRQTNSYDCGAFVCLFATCMYLGIPMDFHQSDAPAMRLKLVHRIQEHSLQCSTPAHVTQSQTTDSSLPSTKSLPLADVDTGYNKIMSSTTTRKWKPVSSPSRLKNNKRSRATHSRLSNRASSKQGHLAAGQMTLDNLLPTTLPKREKRKLNITDEDHPYKHKRYKEDDDET
jgi:hypothetical protein